MGAGRHTLRTLRARLALGVALATVVGMVSFGSVAAGLLALEERLERNERVSESPAEMETDLREGALIAGLVAAPVGALAGMVSALWSTRRVLRIVDRLVAEAGAIAPDRLDRRLSAPDGADELRVLVDALNGLFDRIEVAIAAQARFSDEVSHELRTPLAVMGSHLEVALRRPRTEAEWQRAAEATLAETRRLGRLVDALLELARAGGSDAARLGDVDVRRVVEAVADAPEVDRAVEVVATPHPVVVHGDEKALGLAVANLVRNALRYTEPGVRVRIMLRSGEDGQVDVEVDDAGAGFAVDDLERLRRPFQRGRGTDEIPGSGLGLTIVERIARRHGGTLTLGVSDLGGARATLTLPAAGSSRGLTFIESSSSRPEGAR